MHGKMPPQAYTKETLQEALEWWSHQSDELRAKIQDKDDLVGYYLKVTRSQAYEGNDGGFSKTAKESFSSELKGLAKDLKSFEGYSSSSGGGQKPKKRNLFEPSMQLDLPNMSKILSPAEENLPQKQTINLPANTPTKASDSRFFKLDERSKAAVKSAKEQLNLTSDEEALRALISLGSSRLKKIYE